MFRIASGFERWPGSLCCVLGLDTFFPQYLSLPSKQAPTRLVGYRAKENFQTERAKRGLVKVDQEVKFLDRR